MLSRLKFSYNITPYWTTIDLPKRIVDPPFSGTDLKNWIRDMSNKAQTHTENRETQPNEQDLLSYYKHYTFLLNDGLNYILINPLLFFKNEQVKNIINRLKNSQRTLQQIGISDHFVTATPIKLNALASITRDIQNTLMQI